MLLKLANQNSDLRYGTSPVKAIITNNTALWSRPGFAWKTFNIGVGTPGFKAIVYGGGQFVAVRESQNNELPIERVAVSPDGQIWSLYSAPSSSSWDAIAYGNGVYVATASSASTTGLPRSMYSFDGKVWRPSNINTTATWRSVCYGNNVFVAIGSSGASVSSDGITWGAPTTITGVGVLRSITYGNGIYVAVGSSGTNRIATSTNGTTWTARLAPQANAWYSVVFHNGMFVACSSSGTNRVMTSTDGINWTLRNNSSGGTTISAGDGSFVCSGGTVSQDGINWDNIIISPSLPINGVAYGNNTFVAALSTGAFGTDMAFAISAGKVDAKDFYIDITEQPRLTQSGTTQSIVSKDANITRRTGSTRVSDYIIQPTSLVNKISPVNISISNTNILSTPNVSGIASYVANGLVSVSGTSSQGTSIVRSIRTNNTTEPTVDEFVSYINGSLALNISNTIDNALSPTKNKAIFSVKNHDTATYVRNTNCWSHNIVDLSCVSVWNSVHGAARCGTLISPRHILYAAHYPLSTGSSIRFVTPDNAVVTRQITSKLTATGYKNYYPDFEIGLLDSDIPNTINFARILPASWGAKLPSLYNQLAVLPVLYTNQNEESLVNELVTDLNSVRCRAPQNSTRSPFFSTIVSGDSGHPCFMIIPGSNNPVLLTVWTYGLSGSGTSMWANASIINSLMTSLGGGYQITTADLSSFPSY